MNVLDKLQSPLENTLYVYICNTYDMLLEQDTYFDVIRTSGAEGLTSKIMYNAIDTPNKIYYLVPQEQSRPPSLFEQIQKSPPSLFEQMQKSPPSLFESAQIAPPSLLDLDTFKEPVKVEDFNQIVNPNMDTIRETRYDSICVLTFGHCRSDNPYISGTGKRLFANDIFNLLKEWNNFVETTPIDFLLFNCYGGRSLAHAILNEARIQTTAPVTILGRIDEVERGNTYLEYGRIYTPTELRKIAHTILRDNFSPSSGVVVLKKD